MLNYLTSDPLQTKGQANISAPSIEKNKKKKVDNNGFETFGKNNNWVNGNVYNKFNYNTNDDSFSFELKPSILSIPKSENITVNSSIPIENTGLNSIIDSIADKNINELINSDITDDTTNLFANSDKKATKDLNRNLRKAGNASNKVIKESAKSLNKSSSGLGGLTGIAPKLGGAIGTAAMVYEGIMGVSNLLGLQEKNVADGVGNQLVASYIPGSKLFGWEYKNNILNGTDATSWGGTVANVNSMEGKHYLGLNEAKREGQVLDNQSSDIYGIKQRNRYSNGDYLSSHFNKRINGTVGNFLAKEGTKLMSKKEAQQLLNTKITEENQIQAYQNGGSILVPEGALHAHKHHMEDVNPDLAEDLTKKGIPVIVTDEKGNVEQVAEIEKEELILEKSLTEKIEELWHKGDEESMIEAGKLIVDTLFTNCDDNAELIDRVE